MTTNSGGGLLNHHYAQRTHNNQLRKLVQNRIRIQLDDWSEIRPLTIDKVGTFYRDIYRINGNPSENNSSSNSSSKQNITRLIFDISLSENATKLIEIKSPVSIRNRLAYKLQCRIETSLEPLNAQLGPLIVEVDTDREISIPIKYLPCNLWFRPLELANSMEAEFNALPLSLASVNQPGQVEYVQVDCRLNCGGGGGGVENFQFFARIKRHQFQMKRGGGQSAKSRRTFLALSGHSISIEPAFTLYNLLPLEFRFKFLSPSKSLKKATTTTTAAHNVINGKIESYKLESFANINVSRPVEFLLDLDTLRMQKGVEINPQRHLANLAPINNNKNNKNNNNNNNNSHAQKIGIQKSDTSKRRFKINFFSIML